MTLYLVYTMVQKSQKWPKTQIKGGSCLKNLSGVLPSLRSNRKVSFDGGGGARDYYSAEY